MIDFESAPSSSSSGSSGSSRSFGEPRPVITPRTLDWDQAAIDAFLKGLNEKQREAVQATDGPLIVLAGAGSGKTKMLTSRIAYLISAKKVSAHQILAVTFTNKAAAEMRERVERTLNLAAGAFQAPPVWHGGPWIGAPEIGTFHSVCMRLIRREMDRTGFTKPFVIYDDSDQLSLIKGCFEKLSLDDKAVNPKSIQGAINRLKCDAVEPQELEPATHNLFEKHLKRVYEQYQKDLYANNALDFGEIITLAYRILRDHADVREKYQKRWQYLHVDEYQDTNRAQYLLLSMLGSVRHGGHQNICVVGDEDQSIYKWRGADIRNILDFEQDYPGARVVKLEQNYRSTQTIIKAAAAVIANNSQRRDKTLWTDNEEGLRLVRSQLADERAEAEMVIGEIKKIASEDERAFKEFSIFYRTNAQSRQFEDVFRREKIPYQIVGGLRFYDRKEIKDVLAYLKVVLNPTDSVNLKRIINVPARGIGKTTLDKLEAYHHAESETPQGSSYWDVLRAVAADSSGKIVSAGTAKKIASFVAVVDRLIAEQPKLMLSELYHLLLDETGYARELRVEGTEESLARIENLEEFDNLLKEFEEDQFVNGASWSEEERDARKTTLLPIFLEQSSLVSEGEKADPNVSTVKLMTLHSSKGLEFPVVFLVGMEEGLFPSIRPWEETPDEDIEEERRLCYVGITRARERLFMSHVVLRRFWGNTTYQDPSRFFAEIPDALIEFRDYSQSSRQGGTSRTGTFRAEIERDFGFGKAKAPGAPTPGAGGGGGIRLDHSESQLEGSDSVVGRRLKHPEYGRGTIIASDGSGDQQKVTIDFKGAFGQRKFLLRYVVGFIE
jgi:DNA helicase-2/ATP-dependent DNA helicase PcrA